MLNLTTRPGEKICELGGGANPRFRPNVDVRMCHDASGNQTVDFTADFDRELPMKSDEWDAVFSQYVIEHVSYRAVRGFIAEVFRILKPGGKAVFVTANTPAQLQWIANNPSGWDGRDFFDSASGLLFGDQDYPENTHKNYMSAIVAEQLFRSAGFGDVITHPYGERNTDMVIEAVKPANAPSSIMHVEDRNHVPTLLPTPEPPQRAANAIPEGMTRSEMFDKHYFNGGGKVGGYSREGYRDFPVHEITARHVLARKPKSVLALGEGRGYILKRIHDAGVPGVGLEISKHCFLTRATNNMFTVDMCEEWLIGENESAQFDLCYSVAVLEHIPREHIGHVIREMAQYSKRGLHGIDFGGADDGFDKTHCLPADTSIAMADGTSKLIRDIVEGDVVFGMSDDQRLIPTIVEKSSARTADGLIHLDLDNCGGIEGTDEHPLWVVGKGWTKLANISIGDEVLYVTSGNESDSRTTGVRQGESDNENVPTDRGGSRCIVGVAAASGEHAVRSETRSVDSAEHVDGRGNGNAPSGVPAIYESSDHRTIPEQIVSVDHPSCAGTEHLSGGRDRTSGSTDGSESDACGGGIHRGADRRGGVGIPPEGGIVGESLPRVGNHDRQHGPQDDRLRAESMRGDGMRTDAGTDEASVAEFADATQDAFVNARRQCSRVPCGPDASCGNPVPDYEEGSGQGGATIPRTSIVQAEEQSAGGGRIRPVLRVAKVVSTKRFSRVGTQVYNFRTGCGSYIANRIVVHNCTLQSREWWLEQFAEHAPGYPVEIVDKEVLERGEFPPEVLHGDGRVKLNIGSFTSMHHHGWVNVDVHDLAGYAQSQGYKYLLHDARNGLPYDTGTVDAINCQHMLEHLTYKEGVSFLRECRRVLKPDGVMRVAVPDAELLADLYVNGDDDGDWCPGVECLADLDEIRGDASPDDTDALRFWKLLHDGHQAAYDSGTLGNLALTAGFTPVISGFRQSLPESQPYNAGRVLRETIDMMPCLSLYAWLVPAVDGK